MVDLIILTLMVVGRLDATTLYEKYVNGIIFEEVHPTSFYNDSFDFTDMDIDRYLPGNIVYISYDSLWTISLETREAHALVSGLIDPHSLVQMSPTLVLVTGNGCVLAIDRTNNQSSRLTGKCWSLTSYMDGNFDQARFGKLFGSARITSSAIAVADAENRCIRIIDLADEEVSTLVTLDQKVISLAMQRDKLFFATDPNQIGYYDLITGKLQYITSTSDSQQSNDGSFESAVINGYRISITFLTEDILLAAERPNTIRVIDLALGRVTSLCGGVYETFIVDGLTHVSAGNISECKVFGPVSFVVLPDEEKILVGFLNSIGYIDISGSRCPGYLCKDIKCISYDKVCDGLDDCNSGDDELDCFTQVSSSTEAVITTTANQPVTGLDIEVIVGIIVGVVVLLIVITVLGCVVFRLYRRNNNLSQNDANATYTSTKQNKAAPSSPDNQTEDNTYCDIDSSGYADNAGYMVPIQSRPGSSVSGSK